MTYKTRAKTKYPDSESARRPILHLAEVHVPIYSAFDASDSNSHTDDGSLETNEEDFNDPASSKKAKLFTQGELNDLVQDLE